MVNGTQHWPYPFLFAHRGGGTLAPENTLAAMKVGCAAAYRAVEFDVKLSRDGVAILMHDETLERTTNGFGWVADKPYETLRLLDAGLWLSEAFRGEIIPRFSDVAAYLQAHSMLANVEIKPCPGREAETGAKVAALCSELWQGEAVQPLVSSFRVEALRAARATANRLPMGLLIDHAPHEGVLPVLRELDCVSLHCNHRFINAEWVQFFHGQGYRVMVYTVNDVSRAGELLAMGVDGLFTDKLDVMAAAFPNSLAPIRVPL